MNHQYFVFVPTGKHIEIPPVFGNLKHLHTWSVINKVDTMSPEDVVNLYNTLPRREGKLYTVSLITKSYHKKPVVGLHSVVLTKQRWARLNRLVPKVSVSRIEGLKYPDPNKFKGNASFEAELYLLNESLLKVEKKKAIKQAIENHTKVFLKVFKSAIPSVDYLYTTEALNFFVANLEVSFSDVPRVALDSVALTCTASIQLPLGEPVAYNKWAKVLRVFKLNPRAFIRVAGLPIEDSLYMWKDLPESCPILPVKVLSEIILYCISADIREIKVVFCIQPKTPEEVLSLKKGKKVTVPQGHSIQLHYGDVEDSFITESDTAFNNIVVV